jgi:hypothetical protein
MKSMKHSRIVRGCSAIGGMSLLASAMFVAPAKAADNASTGASVGSSGTAPKIECAWALNDVDHDWTSAPKMTYGQDDSSASAGLPCVATTANDPSGVGQAKMTGNPYGTKVIDVKPNAHDEINGYASEAWVELWGGISTNQANPVVYFDVFHPDGTPKTQVDATKYADASMVTEGVNTRCDGPKGMFNAAQSTGQLTQQATLNMIGECKYQSKQLWYGAFGISKHQPHGMYKVVLTAAAGGGSATTQTYYVNVLPFFNLEKDFTTVDFGAVSKNDHVVQTGFGGNFNFEGKDLAGNQLTSVRNTGNSGIGLGVRFASMCLTSLVVSCTDDKRIDHFDAKFGVGILSNLQSLGNVSLATALVSDLGSTALIAPFGPQNDFDSSLARTLCPNDVGKIEFSIWTENIQAGTYAAANGIQLVAVPNKICPTDNGSVYKSNLGTPQFGNPDTPTSATHWGV